VGGIEEQRVSVECLRLVRGRGLVRGIGLVRGSGLVRGGIEEQESQLECLSSFNEAATTYADVC
jgi:hypothetical protein